MNRNLVCWTEMPRGGHFAALERPALFADDVLAFFRGLRDAIAKELDREAILT